MFGEGRLITWSLYYIHMYRDTTKLSTTVSLKSHLLNKLMFLLYNMHEKQ